MRRILQLVFSLLLLTTLSVQPLYAAQIKSGESVYLSEAETNLRDVYVFGKDVTVDAPVENDFVTAGEQITINGEVTGSVIAAGRDIVLRSNIGNTVRAAGSEIVISGTITRDVILAAGRARITKDAHIQGDVLFFGGELDIAGPVDGKVWANGSEVTINTTVGGSVEGNIQSLTLGSNAIINGDLRYSAAQKATIPPGATIKGQHAFKQLEETQEKPSGLASIITAGSLYKLATDIVICLLLVSFVPLFVKRVLERIINSPAGSAGTGFLVLLFMPLLAIFLLFLIWLGLAAFLLYALLLLIAVFIAKLLIGWWVMRWWERRSKHEYVLDWKAAVVGPLVFFVLFLIPILGWIAGFIIYLMALGGLSRTLFAFAAEQKDKKYPTKSK